MSEDRLYLFGAPFEDRAAPVKRGAIKILRPKTVVVHHYDDWHAPLSSGMTAAVRRRAQRLERDVKSVDRNIRVIIPEFLQTITLE